MTHTYPIDRAHSALTTIQHLLPHWETNQQIRETSDGTHTAASSPDHLPYGLDKTLDTDTHTATYSGALSKLATITHQWETRIGITPHTQSRSATTYAGRCLTYLPSAYRASTPTQWNNDTLTLEQLARDTITHTGRQPKTLTHPCLNCHTPLEQPYTDDGLLDIYLCPHCENYWTPDHYLTLAKALAAYSTTDCLVTQQQAADILGTNRATITTRICRHNIKPISGRGHNKKYRLSDLKNTPPRARLEC